jgi:hypothetical protein
MIKLFCAAFGAIIVSVLAWIDPLEVVLAVAISAGLFVVDHRYRRPAPTTPDTGTGAHAQLVVPV